MQGIDPHDSMQQLADRLDTIAARAEAGTALDGIGDLCDAIDPALHCLADQLTQRPRQRIRDLS